MNVVIYEAATGRPLRLHSGSSTARARAKARVRPGEAWIEGDYDRIAGKLVRDRQLVDAEVTRDDLMRRLREERLARLEACDWTQLPDAQVDQQAWAEYRQALRDMTAGDPANPKWPTPPRK